MSLVERRGKFKMHEDVVFSNDPIVDNFFRQIRVYDAARKDSVVHYKGVSLVFDEIDDEEVEPSYDLYVEEGILYAERNDF
jgi:hypothetical protein